MMKKEYGVGSCVLCAMTALGVIGPTKRLGGLERSRDDLAERDALRAQISPFRYAPASPSRSHTPTTANKSVSTSQTCCVAGHVGLELRNVVAKYPFERSHRFPGIQSDSCHRDYSRLSCRV
jgi:hypothetical protein